MWDTGVNAGDAPARLGFSGLGSSLMQMLMADEIIPGSEPSYQLVKQIFAYHPLGAVLAQAPITLAQSQQREIDIPVLGEERLKERFQETWDTIFKVGATVILNNLSTISRVYGISSLAIGERGKSPDSPLDFAKIADADLFANLLDPLNTAGSLVLDQDPNSPDFLKPSGVRVNGQPWHSSRVHVKLHEQPIYIEWSGSAFGFVGRSVYQRALFPLKSFLQSMLTDQFVAQKVGLLVYKAENPSSIIDNLMQSFGALKRTMIKSGNTNNVLQIGVPESIETLNMQNLDGAGKFARDNILKNIASACGMPATLIAQETMSAEFHEGSEDAKKEAKFVDFIREDMQPAYDFMDRIVMRKAWTPEFYESFTKQYSEYRGTPYETALHDWMRAFKASWPNLLVEPDSEKSKTADVQFKAVVAMVETVGPLLDPENRAKLIAWAAENANEREELFASKLVIDEDTLRGHLEEQQAQAIEFSKEGEQKEPTPPRAFSQAS